MPATSVRCSVPTSMLSLTSLREFGTFSAASTFAVRSSTFMKSSIVILLSAGGAGGAAAQARSRPPACCARRGAGVLRLFHACAPLSWFSRLERPERVGFRDDAVAFGRHAASDRRMSPSFFVSPTRRRISAADAA